MRTCYSQFLPASSPWTGVSACSPALSAPAPWSPQPAPPPAQRSHAGRHSAVLIDALAAAPSSAVPPDTCTMQMYTKQNIIFVLVDNAQCSLYEQMIKLLLKYMASAKMCSLVV